MLTVATGLSFPKANLSCCTVANIRNFENNRGFNADGYQSKGFNLNWLIIECDGVHTIAIHFESC